MTRYAANLVELGRLDEAKTEVETALALNPKFTLRRYRDGAQSNNPAFLKRRDQIIKNMRKAGIRRNERRVCADPGFLFRHGETKMAQCR